MAKKKAKKSAPRAPRKKSAFDEFEANLLDDAAADSVAAPLSDSAPERDALQTADADGGAPTKGADLSENADSQRPGTRKPPLRKPPLGKPTLSKRNPREESARPKDDSAPRGYFSAGGRDDDFDDDLDSDSGSDSGADLDSDRDSKFDSSRNKNRRGEAIDRRDSDRDDDSSDDLGAEIDSDLEDDLDSDLDSDLEDDLDRDLDDALGEDSDRGGRRPERFRGGRESREKPSFNRRGDGPADRGGDRSGSDRSGSDRRTSEPGANSRRDNFRRSDRDRTDSQDRSQDRNQDRSGERERYSGDRSRDSNYRDSQPRDSQARDSQARDGQSRESQSRDNQARDSRRPNRYNDSPGGSNQGGSNQGYGQGRRRPKGPYRPDRQQSDRQASDRQASDRQGSDRQGGGYGDRSGRNNYYSRDREPPADRADNLESALDDAFDALDDSPKPGRDRFAGQRNYDDRYGDDSGEEIANIRDEFADDSASGGASLEPALPLEPPPPPRVLEPDEPTALEALRKLGARMDVDPDGHVWRVILYGRKSRDGALAHMRGLPALRDVWVIGTAVTKEGIEALKSEAPTIKIYA